MSCKFNACLGCKERFLGCHAKCEKYLAEVAENKEEKEQIRVVKEREGQFVAYARQRGQKRR